MKKLALGLLSGLGAVTTGCTTYNVTNTATTTITHTITDSFNNTVRPMPIPQGVYQGTSDYFASPRLFTCNAFDGRDHDGNGVLDARDIEGYKSRFFLNEPLVLYGWNTTDKRVRLCIKDLNRPHREDLKRCYMREAGNIQAPLCCARELGPGEYMATMELDRCGEDQWYPVKKHAFTIDP